MKTDVESLMHAGEVAAYHCFGHFVFKLHDSLQSIVRRVRWCAQY